MSRPVKAATHMFQSLSSIPRTARPAIASRARASSPAGDRRGAGALGASGVGLSEKAADAASALLVGSAAPLGGMASGAGASAGAEVAARQVGSLGRSDRPGAPAALPAAPAKCQAAALTMAVAGAAPAPVVALVAEPLPQGAVEWPPV
eukprot:CAMPEP_0204376614 /NCGR_PEP_ID=MMETSP0469-20131031/50234_1 /ASSEMBLY_ACC=CAM_ASM_000384 /TAXON_ID=2969 /ORGANISM="Oxyrrhis marina" /LENGTH=148 /DNA_ID=CAMNT_0051367519 /DNA_START=286 /DNA_END=730 /DNA_ORIENTATION=+